ncbi:MAG TPA: ATP-binding protein [Mariniphaga anaerophila]|uniref:ATP-binding protein n=1 Tax=Mariniphaga anaerophila TaxID=1484053 RepID=A0A831LIV0_9BACT|nr:ATP-binding protein [Mariniphaga anaerophila]
MVKNISPFRFGQVVDSNSFTNRKNEFKLLEKNLFSGNHLIIISPRRYGKTSLVEQFIIKNKTEPEIIHCMIDLFSIRSEEEFYAEFARKVIKSTSGKLEEWIENAKSFFRNIVPRISLGVDPVNDFSVSFDLKEIKKHKSEILNLPSEIAQKKQKRIIIYIDEFQNIGTFSDSLNFQKSLRSVWQKHHNVSYCFFGSKRHMMLDIFNKTEAPFYRFGSLLILDRIDLEHWEEFITKLFEKTNKKISKELAVEIANLMKNHPHYVQQLAHFTWTYTDKSASREAIQNALEFMLNSNSPLFIKIIEDLSVTQINLLKAISKGEKQLTSHEVMINYSLGTPRNVFKNKAILEGKDVIDVKPDELLFIDPLFEIWFKKNV